MTLTADQLENLIENASNADYTTDGNMAACDAARRDLAAMRTPITAEALTAAGWRLDYEIASKGNFTGRKLFVFGNRLIGVSIWDDGDACLYYKGSGDYIPMPPNMYALGQLVELLGGGA